MEDSLKVSEIPAELSRIWDSFEGTSKMRASLFNLLVIAPKNSRIDYIRQITHKVLERFPSRVIFVSIDSTSDEKLDASVSVIPISRGQADVMCDFIEIEATQKTSFKLPFIFLPHLLPDLPIYLLWTEDPVKNNPLLQQLEQWSTRIIFDSEITDNLPAFAQTLLKHYQQSGCEIADLNWARTENWRELISSTFYSMERLSALRNAQKISIVYNAFTTPFFHHTKIQALYLQSWLATQLGWKLSKAQPSGFEYGTLTITLEAMENNALAPGAVISLEIEAQSQNHFSFVREKDQPDHIKTIICDIEKCEIPSKYIFSKTQIGLSLTNEIGHVGTSPHFQKVLEFLSPLDPACL